MSSMTDHKTVEEGTKTEGDGSAQGEEGRQEAPADPKDDDPDMTNLTTFPQKLMDILSDESVANLISWLPHGKGFMIHDKKRFAEEVLPTYFKKTKFTSFTRKLNRWNFVRVTRGPEVGAYYHQYFVRDNPKLVSQMACINSKSPQQLQPMNPVALGLGTAGHFSPESPSADPASAQRMHEQHQAFMQQQWQQHQMFMAWMAQQQQQQNAGKQEGGDSEEKTEKKTGSTGGETKQDGEASPMNNAAAMMAFQQQQYYAMFMAHQHQMAKSAQGQQPAGNMMMMPGFMMMPSGGAPPAENGSGPGDAGGDAKTENKDDSDKEDIKAAAASDEGAETHV